MPRSPRSDDGSGFSDDDGSVLSGYESALAEPLSPRLDSEDDMEPLLLGAEDGANRAANPNAPAPAHAAQTLMHRLAMRVQAAAAGGPQDAGGPNSPQLDPVRQLQVEMQQQGPQVHQLHQQMQHIQQQVQQRMQQALHVQQQQAQGMQQAQEPQEENAGDGRAYKFCCKHCPDRFTHINLLTRHLNEVHPVSKPFVCPGPNCGRGYVVRETMEAHFMMVHRGDRPYPCDQCEKVFSRREYLVTHSRVHTGFKPYQCGDCGRRFAWKGCIDIHRRTHTGERPYLCTTCSKDFATLSTLKMHEMIHTNSFPFECPLTTCDRKFRCSTRLRMHSQEHENEADITGTEDDVAAVAEVAQDSRTEDEVAVAVLNQL